MNIYEYSDYKEVLKAQIDRNRLEKAYRSLLAEKMGCQKSFFSQVMNSHVHLTPDHAASLAQFWGFSEEESTYFLDLVSLARASSPALKKLLKAKIKKAHSTLGNPSERFKWPQVSDGEAERTYYSSWYWSAIHILVSSPKYQSVQQIADRLHLKVEVVEPALRFLEKSGLIEKAAYGGWTVTEKFLHLPNTSVFNEGHQTGWRQKSIQNIQTQDKDALHYTSVFTVSPGDFNLLKEILVSSISSCHSLIAPSSPEELFCLNCDLFQI